MNGQQADFQLQYAAAVTPVIQAVTVLDEWMADSPALGPWPVVTSAQAVQLQIVGHTFGSDASQLEVGCRPLLHIPMHVFSHLQGMASACVEHGDVSIRLHDQVFDR